MKKFNYKKFIIFCLCCLVAIILIIFGISKLIKKMEYKRSYEYKFVEIGYKVEEFKQLQKKLSEKKLNELLKIKYNPDIISFVNQKYFLYKNLNKYLEYRSADYKSNHEKIVSIVNTESNIEWIDISKETDISKGELMLVNRLYGLNNEYEPQTNKLSLQYSYGTGEEVDIIIYDDLIAMIDDAKEDNIKLIVSAGYRSYESQEKIYNNKADSIGYSEADKYVARPGHSEYQTGLSVAIVPFRDISKEDEYETDEYQWLFNNSYKYGFIIRFPQEKEYITKFDAEAWRLRYVGIDAAKKIYKEKISFEEYYAYYVIGEDNE